MSRTLFVVTPIYILKSIHSRTEYQRSGVNYDEESSEFGKLKYSSSIEFELMWFLICPRRSFGVKFNDDSEFFDESDLQSGLAPLLLLRGFRSISFFINEIMEFVLLR